MSNAYVHTDELDTDPGTVWIRQQIQFAGEDAPANLVMAVSHDLFSMSQHLQDKKRIYKPGKIQYALECILCPIGSSLTLFEIWERGADVPLGCLGG